MLPRADTPRAREARASPQTQLGAVPPPPSSTGAGSRPHTLSGGHTCGQNGNARSQKWSAATRPRPQLHQYRPSGCNPSPTSTHSSATARPSGKEKRVPRAVNTVGLHPESVEPVSGIRGASPDRCSVWVLSLQYFCVLGSTGAQNGHRRMGTAPRAPFQPHFLS